MREWGDEARRATGPPRSGLSAGVGLLFGLLALWGGHPAAAAPAPARPTVFPPPIDTGLPPSGSGSGSGASAGGAAADERIVVRGSRYRQAPVAAYGDERTPWDAARAIRDPRTGTDTTRFGNAYNLGSIMGSDERSNETGGVYVAPHHD